VSERKPHPRPLRGATIDVVDILPMAMKRGDG
jgi:hypothetical protein